MPMKQKVKRHLDFPILRSYLQDLPKSKWLSLEFLFGVGDLEAQEKFSSSSL